MKTYNTAALVELHVQQQIINPGKELSEALQAQCRRIDLLTETKHT